MTHTVNISTAQLIAEVSINARVLEQAGIDATILRHRDGTSLSTAELQLIAGATSTDVRAASTLLTRQQDLHLAQIATMQALSDLVAPVWADEEMQLWETRALLSPTDQTEFDRLYRMADGGAQ